MGRAKGAIANILRSVRLVVLLLVHFFDKAATVLNASDYDVISVSTRFLLNRIPPAREFLDNSCNLNGRLT